MAYRYDNDLSFLGKLENDDLNDLVYILTHDKDGSERITEELTSNALYKKFYPKHKEYWKEIAAELQCFGGNSLATIFRGGKGVLYREILDDVCDQMIKKKPSSSLSTAEAENFLLENILSKAVGKMTEAELREFAKETNFNATSKLSKEAIIAAAQTIFKMSGFRSYQLTLLIANTVYRAIFSKGLTLAANATITRTVGVLAGPIGWLITGIWTAIDVAGPAYRVTIPAVIQVALLRQMLEMREHGELKKAIYEEFDIDETSL